MPYKMYNRFYNWNVFNFLFICLETFFTYFNVGWNDYFQFNIAFLLRSLFLKLFWNSDSSSITGVLIVKISEFWTIPQFSQFARKWRYRIPWNFPSASAKAVFSFSRKKKNLNFSILPTKKFTNSFEAMFYVHIKWK